jgi:hypothetical protein
MDGLNMGLRNAIDDPAVADAVTAALTGRLTVATLSLGAARAAKWPRGVIRFDGYLLSWVKEALTPAELRRRWYDDFEQVIGEIERTGIRWDDYPELVITGQAHYGSEPDPVTVSDMEARVKFSILAGTKAAI